MKKVFKQAFRFGLTTFLSILVVLGVEQIGQAQQIPIPNSVKPCIPGQVRAPITRTELIAQASAKGTTYYLLYTFSASETGGTDLVISVTGKQCKEEFYNAPGDAISLTKVVSRDVANQLALGRYKNEVAQFGHAKVQANINRVIASNGTFYPEELWALKRLGFRLPANARVSQ